MNRISFTPRRTSALLAATVAALALVAAPPAGATTPARTATVAHPANKNKVSARRVVEGLARGRVGIIAQAFGPDYVEHAVAGQDGLTALTQRVAAQHAAHPRARTKIYRVLGEGDLVFVHSHLVLDPGTRGSAVADIYRFKNGRIVEHWGGSQDVPATTASGNDMFSTLSSPRRLSPDPKADPAQTRATVIGLFTTLVANKDLGAWDQYAQEPYYQHSINTPNGIKAVKEIWGPVLLDPTLTITLVNMVVDGDLVVAQDLLTTPGSTVEAFDISRVRNGKIVEHWDVLQNR